MAGNRIKGITIEIGGDTTGLQKSLKAVDSSIRNTQTALKDVNKLLKLDPKNTELLRQKQELLKSSISDTKDRLYTLKNAYKDLDGKGTEEAKQQQQALAREIIETEQSLKSLKEQYSDFGSVAKQKLTALGNDMKEVGESISGVGNKLSVSVTAPLVALGTLGVSFNAEMEKYKTIFTTLTGSAEEADRVISQLQADASKTPFDTASLVEANQYLLAAGVDADEARTAVMNLGNAIAATGGGSAELSRMAANMQQIKNTGKATAQDIKQFANAGINIYGLLSDYTGKTIKQVQEMDVSYDVLTAALAKASEEGGQYYGAMAAQSETFSGTLAATKASLEQLLGSITEAAMPIIAQILQKVKDLIDGFNSMDAGTKKRILIIGSIIAAIGPALTIIGGIISAVGTLTTVVGALMSPIGIVVAAVVGIIAVLAKLYKSNEQFRNSVNKLVTGAVAKFKQIYEGAKTFILGMKPFIEEVKRVFSAVFENVVITIKTQLSIAKQYVTMVWNAIRGVFKAVGQLLKGDVKGAFSTIKDTIKNVLSSAKEIVATYLNSIKEKFSSIFESAKSIVSDAIEKIKSFLKFEWKLPELKTPHLSWSLEPLDPSGVFYKILDALGIPTSLPKLSVDWYRKAMQNGMILNGATIFGARNGKLLGAGEAGSETVVGTNSLYRMIQSAVGAGGMTVNMTVNGSGISANELAEIVTDKLTARIIRNNQRW